MSPDYDRRSPGTETILLSRKEMTDQYSQELADAAFALARPGDISPVVHARDSLYILRLLSREPATVADMDNQRLRETVRSQITTKRRTEAVGNLLTDLKKRQPVVIDEKVLATISLPPPKLTPATQHLPDSLSHSGRPPPTPGVPVSP
jgi:hypothetical protein